MGSTSNGGALCLVIPSSGRGVRSFLDFRDEAGGSRICSLGGSRIVLARGVTSLLGMGIKSRLAVRSRSEKSRAIAINTVYRGCVDRCLCLSPRGCRRLCNMPTRCGAVVCDTGSKGSSRVRGVKAGLLSVSKMLGMDCADDVRKELSSVLQDLGLIVIMLVMSTKVLTFIMLCGLGGVGVARHRERLTALGILKFCSKRITSCMCERGVLLAVVKSIINVILNGLLRQCVVLAIRIRRTVFKHRVR